LGHGDAAEILGGDPASCPPELDDLRDRGRVGRLQSIDDAIRFG
jgi:hypothetical protein